MASVIGICNSALIKLGATTIMSLDEQSRNANLCKEQYEKLRDELLRSHTWNFATARAKLARLAASPVFGVSHAFQLPADFLRALSVVGSDTTSIEVEYRIEGRRLISDSAAIWMRYVRAAGDPNEMDPSFREALAWRLAVDLALPITQSSTVLGEMREGLTRAVLGARSIDALEDAAEQLPESGWVSIRG